MGNSVLAVHPCTARDLASCYAEIWEFSETTDSADDTDEKQMTKTEGNQRNEEPISFLLSSVRKECFDQPSKPSRRGDCSIASSLRRTSFDFAQDKLRSRPTHPCYPCNPWCTLTSVRARLRFSRRTATPSNGHFLT